MENDLELGVRRLSEEEKDRLYREFQLSIGLSPEFEYLRLVDRVPFSENMKKKQQKSLLC